MMTRKVIKVLSNTINQTNRQSMTDLYLHEAVQLEAMDTYNASVRVATLVVRYLKLQMTKVSLPDLSENEDRRSSVIILSGFFVVKVKSNVCSEDVDAIKEKYEQSSCF